MEQGRVPLVALAEANLQALTDSQLQNMPVSPAKISRTTPSALQTREINSYYIPWRFRGHLLHSVLVATGNSYMVPVLKKKKKKAFNQSEDISSLIMLDSEQRQEK